MSRDDEHVVLEWPKDRAATARREHARDLVNFLQDRLNEYETEVSEGRWHRPSCTANAYQHAPCDCGVLAWSLADIAAKRLIIAEHQPVPAVSYIALRPGAFGCARCHLDEGVIEPEGWCLTIRALVLPFGEHPECHPSWLPPVNSA